MVEDYNDQYTKCLKFSSACLICNHEKRVDIHKEYSEGSTFDQLQSKYNIPATSICVNHFKQHFSIEKQAQTINTEPEPLKKEIILPKLVIEGSLAEKFEKGDVDVYSVSYTYFRDKIDLINDIQKLRDNFKALTGQDNIDYIEKLNEVQNSFYKSFHDFCKNFIVLKGDKSIALLEVFMRRLTKTFKKHIVRYEQTEPVVSRAINDLLQDVAETADQFEDDIVNVTMKQDILKD